MARKSKTNLRLVVAAFIAMLVFAGLAVYFINTRAGADLTTEIKKSQGMDLARFQINPVSSWNAPAKVTFRVAAARWMFYGYSPGQSASEPQNPKVTGRFFCNKPFISGLNYPTGLYEPPDAKFEDGAPWPPTDVQDGHNGMNYIWLPGENYERNAAMFWDTTVSTAYTTTCTYSQPGEYWPLFYADGLGAWYTQKIIVTGTGVVVTPTPSPSPSVTVTSTATSVANKDLYQAGYTQIGFRQDVQTRVFADNGLTILNFNKASKSWDQITAGEYLFEAGKAYYVYTPTAKYVDKISLSPITSTRTYLSSGWNFVWIEGNSYLGDISITYRNANNLCVAQNTPLRTLKDENLIYKWIYNVVDDNAATACQAFKLLTGKDQNYTGCTLNNPLLNETSYAKARSGLWIYVWPNKIETWSKKQAYPCY